MSALRKKNVIGVLLDPFQRFLRVESAGGIVLMFFTLLALVWANSPYGHLYHKLWESQLSLSLGHFTLSKPIHHWINDGLMAIFFFVVGLEIKREMIAGELSSLKQASLPIAAAIGGMIMPALIYLLLNTDHLTEGGWGIPMATDIAFSLGVLSLLGKRVPLNLKVFLVAFAIVDDLGAVIVIALFYSGTIYWSYLLIALGLFILLVIMNLLQIRAISAYMIVGWVIWFLFMKSGIHPTIAGVLIAFCIPLNRKIDAGTFKKRMERNMQVFATTDKGGKLMLTKPQLMAIDNMEDELFRVQSPVQSLEHTLHYFVTFFVMPLFALANAGVELDAVNLGDIFHGTGRTIIVSMIVGKAAGIFLFTWLSVKTGIGELPKNSGWFNILGISLLGGMGFTMSLFISALAFEDSGLLNPAKIGILAGSMIAGIIGYFVLSLTLKQKTQVVNNN